MIAIVITVILSAIAGIAWALCASSTDGEHGEEDKENDK